MYSLKQHEQMLFALLRASLKRMPTDVSCFQQVSEEGWKQCYRLAKGQGGNGLGMGWGHDASCQLAATGKVEVGLGRSSREVRKEVCPLLPHYR